MKIKFGVHVECSKDAILNVDDNIGIIQIFVYNPVKNVRLRSMNNPKEILDACSSKKLDLYVHSNYLTGEIWGINKKNIKSDNSKRILNHFIKQMELSDMIGSLGFVVHIPKKKSDKIIETLSLLELELDKLPHKIKTPVLLENPNAKPSQDLTYEESKNLRKLCKNIQDHVNKLKWGLCIDTAHLWSSGIDINNLNVVKEWFFNLYDSKKKIKLIHFNGSSREIGSHVDIHEIAFSRKDKIWNFDRNNAGIYFLKICKNNKFPIVCEINRGSSYRIKKLLDKLSKL
jgi:endonuclease IV